MHPHPPSPPAPPPPANRPPRPTPPPPPRPSYYGDDDSSYYEDYGYYANDAFGYDEYYDEMLGDYGGEGKGGKEGKAGGDAGGDAGGAAPPPPALSDCVVVDGKPELANSTAPCTIRISGVDKVADQLPGGIDGDYELTSCHNGRPLYVRTKTKDRVLWYSTGFGDWDVANGTVPNEQEILMYGGDTQHAVVPLFVTGWHLGADLNSEWNELGDDDYFPVDAKVACADGEVYEEPEYNAALERTGPILTDEEIEAKYRLVFEKYGKRPEPNPTVNFSFIVLLVMIGLTTVLAIPYLLIYQRDARAKGYAPVATTSFAQIIQQSKKKQSGHIN
ncbi:MAG: hypothetical protein J3K34DRAFT_365783 [Monoraphidium minutum]|nr:MAG: hypothetical protein J3K34DRAFT_365783 [Monoraphidium minutum]